MLNFESIASASTFYHSKGWTVIPLHDKSPCILKWTEVSHDSCLQHLRNHDGNIGVVTGPASGLVVLDIDVKDDGLLYWEREISLHKPFETLTCLTGGGGRHYYFKYDERTATLPNKSKVCNFGGQSVGWDIRTKGGQIVLPPSIHKSGAEYMWITEEWIDPISMPEWLYQVISSGGDGGDMDLVANPLRDPPISNYQPSNDNTVQKLLALLSPERAENYDSWIQVGMALKSNGIENLSLWDEWSKQSDKYEDGVCEEKWESFNSGGGKRLTIGSLHYWAQKDNPEGYAKLGVLGVYDINEPYYFLDFRRDCLKQKAFPTLDEAEAFLKEKGGKCIRIIERGCRAVILKSNPESPYEVLPWDKFISGRSKQGVHYKSYHYDDQGNKMDKLEFLSLPSYLDNAISFYYNNVGAIPYHPWEEDPVTDDDYLNIFPGYQAKRVDKVSKDLLKPILWHIGRVLANGNKEIYSFLIRWLAKSIQRPRSANGVMPIFYGAIGGEGKGIILHWLAQHLFGPKISYCATGLDKIIEFSGCLLGKIFIYIDELVRADASNKNWYSTFEMLKPKITEPTFEVRILYNMPTHSKNHTIWCGTSNNDHCVPLSGGNTRRFLPLEVSPIYVGSHDYYKELTAALIQETADHFYTFLCELEVSVDDLATTLPSTDLGERMKEESKDYAELFVSLCLKGDIDISEILHLKDGKTVVLVCEIYQLYYQWCKEINATKIHDEIRFSSRGLIKNGLTKFGQNQITVSSKRGTAYIWPLAL